MKVELFILAKFSTIGKIVIVWLSHKKTFLQDLLVSVAEQAGLNLVWLQTPKTGFLGLSTDT